MMGMKIIDYKTYEMKRNSIKAGTGVQTDGAKKSLTPEGRWRPATPRE
jgi:hypothetical protein